jgi:hypothetical protein
MTSNLAMKTDRIRKTREARRPFHQEYATTRAPLVLDPIGYFALPAARRCPESC